MKKFKPSMKDGLGNELQVSPEAHKEWSDKEGKHSSVNMSIGKSSDHLTPKSQGGVNSSFDPLGGPKQGKQKAHEAAQQLKSKHAANNRYSSASKADAKHATGPMKHAGKGGEGVIKGKGAKGKSNSGNGLSIGRHVKGLTK